MASPDYEPDLHEEELEQTQQTQLSTQQYSQSEAEQPDPTAHLWGFLLPCSPRLMQLDFWRMKPTYTIGRGHDNAIRLPGMRISAFILLREYSLACILTLWTRLVLRQQTLHHSVGRERSNLSGRRQGSVHKWNLRTLNTEQCCPDL